MFSKFLEKASLHGGGVAAFLTIFAILFLLSNSTAFAKLNNGVYLVAATNNSSNNKTTAKSKYQQQAEDYEKKLEQVTIVTAVILVAVRRIIIGLFNKMEILIFSVKLNHILQKLLTFLK